MHWDAGWLCARGVMGHPSAWSLRLREELQNSILNSQLPCGGRNGVLMLFCWRFFLVIYLYASTSDRL